MIKKLLAVFSATMLLFGLIAFSGCSQKSVQGAVVVIYTANLRGNVDSLSKLSSAKESYENRGAEVILVDGGNFLQGTVYSGFDGGQEMIKLMEQVGYSAVNLGAYDFCFGNGKVGTDTHGALYADDSIGKYLENSQIAALSVNTLIGDTLAYQKSFTKTTLSGKKVGFVGATDVEINKTINKSNIEGLEFLTFDDTKNAINSAIAELSDCDFTVSFTNSDFSGLTSTVNIVANKNAAFAFGAVIAYPNGSVENLKLSLEDYQSSEAIASSVQSLKLKAHTAFAADEVLKSSVSLDGREQVVRGEESSLGNLFTDALLWFANEGGIATFYTEEAKNAGNSSIKVDQAHTVAVWNGGNLRDSIYSGDLTAKELARVLPYPNRVAVVYLTGNQLVELLESASQGLKYSEEKRAVCSSFLQVAGIKYSVNTKNEYQKGDSYGAGWFKAKSINRVSVSEINGQELDGNALYAVITSNAIANGMDSHYVALDKGENSTITEAVVRDVVFAYIKNKLNREIPVRYATTENRIEII